MEFKVDDVIRVANEAPHHKNRIGFFRFLSNGDTVVLSALPVESDKKNKYETLFAIHQDYAVKQ